MTEKEKMLAGELYTCDDALKKEHCAAVGLCAQLNDFKTQDKQSVIAKLFGKVGKNPEIAGGFYCDYGTNIEVGDNFYANFGVCILDVCKVTIGNNAFIAPQVGIYTAYHPLDRATRIKGLEAGKPITIGNDCWIGGGAIINPGVTLGDNVVVGSGTVVTKSFPSNVVIAGNPARIIKKL